MHIAIDDATRLAYVEVLADELRELLAGTPKRSSPGLRWGSVETKKEIREFLTSRRARVTPEQAGLATYGARRVPGLRREEVAVLAGVSIQYYTRLERGDMSGASRGVLEALARALQLDDAERAHLFDVARAAQPTGAPARRRQPKQRIRPEIQWTLDTITGVAAYVGNDRLDILATNQLGRALFSDLYAAPERPRQPRPVRPHRPARRNVLRRLGPRCPRDRRDPALGRRRDPYDRDLSDLVGGLATRSDAFRTHWAAHNVRFHATAVKHFHHPVVGELSLSFNRLDIAADHGLTLFTYAAEPGSRSEDALNLLGSWAATIDLTEPAGRTTTAEPRARTRCRPAGVRTGVVLSKRLDTCVGMRRGRGRAAAFAFLRPCRTPSPRYRNASELR